MNLVLKIWRKFWLVSTAVWYRVLWYGTPEAGASHNKMCLIVFCTAILRSDFGRTSPETSPQKCRLGHLLGVFYGGIKSIPRKNSPPKCHTALFLEGGLHKSRAVFLYEAQKNCWFCVKLPLQEKGNSSSGLPAYSQNAEVRK